MNRELFLLSSFQVPTKHRFMLDADEVAAFLNGYLALWHPLLLRDAEAPPKVASPYDHEQPKAGAIYAIPDNPHTFLPEDWPFRLKETGALSFKTTADREETWRNLAEALQTSLPIDSVTARYAGLGLGCLVLQALADAMDHANPLNEAEFWHEVQRAARATDDKERQEALQNAAEKLKEAREILYSSHLYQLDLASLEQGQPLPVGMEVGTPVNLISTGLTLRLIAEVEPQIIDRLKQGMHEQLVEVVAGPWEEETEALWPVERQLDSLRKSLTEYRRLLGTSPHTFGRRRFAATAHLPAMLHACGLRQLLLIPFDTSVLPSFKGAMIEWNTANGKGVSALIRKPEPTHEAGTYFHLAQLLHESIQHDFTACLILGASDKPAAPWHRDWLELHKLAPVFGQFVTLSQFLTEVSPSDYPTAIPADDFQSDYLVDLHDQKNAQPVSRFAMVMRAERQKETIFALEGMERTLTCARETQSSTVEQRLAHRVLTQGAGTTSGALIFNPCNFPRCVPVELPGVKTPLPSPARATQLDAEGAKAVVEVPSFGFAWVPKAVAPGTTVSVPKIKMVQNLTLRNEFLEAEIDPQTGGLKAVRDAGRQIGRLGQQLVYQPGSTMKATEVKATLMGPALGEIVAAGELLDSQNEVLATFRQRFRLWWARPHLEIQLELKPTRSPQGYPWHAYFGARFAWRDPQAQLKRSVGWATQPTSLTRPETPDFLEIYSTGHRTCLLTGGLPFHQRHGPRMVDVVLIPEGETATRFELAITLDAEEPLCSAYDWLTPPVVVPVEQGPPAAGPMGWLCEVDSSNLLVTNFQAAGAGADAVILRICECRGVESEAALRCARDPVRAVAIDEFGEAHQELEIRGDAVVLHFGPFEMLRLRVEFTRPSAIA